MSSQSPASKGQSSLASLWGVSPSKVVPAEQRVKAFAARESAREAQVVQFRQEQSARVPGGLVCPPIVKAASGGSRGGRSRLPTELKRGVAGGGKSNKRQLGECVRRRDPRLVEKLAMIARRQSVLREFRAEGGHVFMQAKLSFEEWCGFGWDVVGSWAGKHMEYVRRLQDLRLGKWGVRPFGCSLPQCQLKSTAQSRLRGETVNYQSGVLKQLKHWVELKRSVGITTYSATCRSRYIMLLQQEAVRVKAAILELTRQYGAGVEAVDASAHKEAQELLVKYRADFESLQKRLRVMNSPSELKNQKYWSRILVQVGCGKYKGQRVTKLSPNEEFDRVRLTWESFDRAQYVAKFGTEQELLEVVRDPESWRANLRSTVWVLWDHSAVWLKSASGKVVLSEAERVAKHLRKKATRLVRSEGHRAEGLELAVAQSNTCDSAAQVRGVSDGGDAKFRLTLIFFQSVEGWFDESATPRGFGRVNSHRVEHSSDLYGVLIVKGSRHCRFCRDRIHSSPWLPASSE